MMFNYKSALLGCCLLFFSLSTFGKTSHLWDDPHFPFRDNQLSFGYYDKNFIDANPPHPPHPIFFGSQFEVSRGFNFDYKKTVFHTKKYLSINFGTSLSEWELNAQEIWALSAYFELRWWIIHTAYFNPYVIWSIAGPSVLSRNYFAGAQLGSHFIFQDYVGVGAQFGKQHTVNLEVKMYHYSNGDLFVHNDGLNVPIVFVVGYSF